MFTDVNGRGVGRRRGLLVGRRAVFHGEQGSPAQDLEGLRNELGAHRVLYQSRFNLFLALALLCGWETRSRWLTLLASKVPCIFGMDGQ